MRIILAEDQAPTARIMRLALEKQGYDVDVQENGADAFDAIMANPPDVLITDIEMPIMTGQELCQLLEREYPERTFPIYVVTSVTDLVHRAWTRDIDDLFFIEKPVSIKRLTQVLEARFH
jgi:DNA-binding response OmpR family regulator